MGADESLLGTDLQGGALHLHSLKPSPAQGGEPHAPAGLAEPEPASPAGLRPHRVLLEARSLPAGPEGSQGQHP